MPESPVQRRLAAILAANVVGYTRLMQLDESGTLDILRSRRKTVLMPLLNRHSGRLFKLVGEGAFVEFGRPRAVGAGRA